MLSKIEDFSIHRKLFWAFSSFFLSSLILKASSTFTTFPKKLCRFFLLLTSTTNNDELNLKKIKESHWINVFSFISLVFRDVLASKIKEKGKKYLTSFLFLIVSFLNRLISFCCVSRSIKSYLIFLWFASIVHLCFRILRCSLFSDLHFSMFWKHEETFFLGF